MLQTKDRYLKFTKFKCCYFYLFSFIVQLSTYKIISTKGENLPFVKFFNIAPKHCRRTVISCSSLSFLDSTMSRLLYK